MRRHAGACCAALSVLVGTVTRLGAQEPTRPQELPGVRVESDQIRAIPPVRCHGETITTIEIDTRPPYLSGMLDRWQFVSRLITDLHVTTKPEVVRRFLALREGEPCTEIRRAESERLLRAQPFLAGAAVRPIPDGEGRVRLLVQTRDEITIVAGVRARQGSPNLRMLRAGEGNVAGEAIYAAAEWQAGTYGRDVFAARVVDYQLMGRPYQLELEGRREQIGGHWRGALTHPYFTDLQRVAWRASGGSGRDFFELRQPWGREEVALATRSSYADVGGLVRVGVPGRLSLFGLGLTTERAEVDPVAMLLLDSGAVIAPDSLRPGLAYTPIHSTRLNAMWGVRNVSFLPVEGFDALSAVQDMRVGFQAGAMFGRSLAMLGSRDDDIFVAADLYAGMGTERTFVTVEAQGEGRQDYDNDRWDSVLGSARVAWYFHAAPRQTLQTSVEWSGGWRTRTPFQLLLGDDDGGVRGYGNSRIAGARRTVARVESRWTLGQFRESAEYGLAVFTDAGRTWAGDVPFGQDSGVKVGFGVGLLAALPPGSQRLWRLDVAYPIVSDPHARIELRLSSSNVARLGWREPRDVERSRGRTVPEGVFRWP
ncbi:MAG TPA: BamA/TamA family outer membrane protein [Gemmatimonadales bacterium]